MAPKTITSKDGKSTIVVAFKPGPNHLRCTMCSKLDQYANSPLQGFWFGPSHNGKCPRANCTFVARANAKQFSSTQPAKADAPSPAATPATPKAGNVAALQKQLTAEKKQREALEKQLKAAKAARAKGGDDVDDDSDEDVAQEEDADDDEEYVVDLARVGVRREGWGQGWGQG